MCQITASGDPIKGLYNTVAGGPTGGFEGRFAGSSERPPQVIDNNLTTKYLNYGTTSVGNAQLTNPGKDSGFYVTPNVGYSMANGVLFAAANDFAQRDPLTVTIEGTNATNLNATGVWTLLYNGPTGLDPINNHTRNAYGTAQVFSNSIAYKSYRVLITSQRGIEDSVQYAEAHIMKYC